MDEIKYKLKTQNSVIIANAFEKLINIIENIYNSPETNKDFVYKNEELHLLRDKCSDSDAVISLTACQGLLTLVENGVLDIAQTMSTILTILPKAKNFPAFISALTGLLILDLKQQLKIKQIFKCQLSLKAPQHPFIMIMEQNFETADDIIEQMYAICLNHNYIIQQNSLELLRPVFLWLICNPGNFHNEWRQKSWQLLVTLDEHKMQKELMVECLSWQQLNEVKHLRAAFQAYSLMIEIAAQKKNIDHVIALLPIIGKISTSYILQGCDPRACYNCIDRIITSENVGIRSSVGLTLMMLAKNIAITPSLYLNDLLILCYKLITKCEVQSQPLSMLIVNLLQWLYHPSRLADEALKIAEQILIHYQEHPCTNKHTSSNLYSNKLFQTLMHTDSEIFLNLELLKMWEALQEETEDKTLNVYDAINRYSKHLKEKIAGFLLAVFLDSQNENVSRKVLDILLELVKVKNELSVPFLPVLIYKIVNCKSAELRVDSFKAIPFMAVSKENVPTVVSLLNKMRQSKTVPISMLIHCFCTLSEVQVRCFPYLHELLVETYPIGANDVAWEIKMAKMNAVIRLCENSNHGKELVGVISSALASSSEPSVCAGAVRAARALVRSGALHAPAAARALPKNAQADIIQANICDLLSEVPMGLPQNIESNSILTSCICILWDYIIEGKEPMVIERACAALSCYRLEDMALKHIPEIYREGIGLPPECCKTPIDAARNPEDVLEYVPAEVWPNVFKYTNQLALEGVKKLCQSYISREIKAFRSGVYATNPRTGEPTNMAYLSNKSVLRGLMEFIRKQAVHPSYDCPPSALSAMLECVASEYPRPLPPMTYAHLPELVSRVNICRKGAFTLSARQALVSGSARSYIDSYLIELDPANCAIEESYMVFDLLPVICRNVRPDVIRQFIEKFINHHYNLYVHRRQTSMTCEEEMFDLTYIWKSISLALGDERIHEANMTLLSHIVKNYFTLMDVESEVWSSYSQACATLPSDHIESLTSPLNWWETTTVVILKSMDIRSINACAECDLVWINDIIDVAVEHASVHSFVLSRLVACLFTCSSNEKSQDWFMKLLARVQVAFNSGERKSHFHHEIKGEELLLPIDVAISLFPAAIASIVDTINRDDQARIIEWLFHSRSIKRVESDFKAVLDAALVSCRSCDHYRAVWTKILSVKMY